MLLRVSGGSALHSLRRSTFTWTCGFSACFHRPWSLYVDARVPHPRQHIWMVWLRVVWDKPASIWLATPPPPSPVLDPRTSMRGSPSISACENFGPDQIVDLQLLLSTVLYPCTSIQGLPFFILYIDVCPQAASAEPPSLDLQPLRLLPSSFEKKKSNCWKT